MNLVVLVVLVVENSWTGWNMKSITKHKPDVGWSILETIGLIPNFDLCNLGIILNLPILALETFRYLKTFESYGNSDLALEIAENILPDLKKIKSENHIKYY